jgi:hypothetical protein
VSTFSVARRLAACALPNPTAQHSAIPAATTERLTSRFMVPSLAMGIKALTSPQSSCQLSLTI